MNRLTRTTIVLPVVLLSLSQVPADPKALDGLTVHEWGTFTSIAGEDGMAVEWKPLAGPDDCRVSSTACASASRD